MLRYKYRKMKILKNNVHRFLISSEIPTYKFKHKVLKKIFNHGQ